MKSFLLSVERLEDRFLLRAGDLDPSFGVGGKVLMDLMAPAVVSSQQDQKIVLQPDGKTLAMSTVDDLIQGGRGSFFGLARYNPDGSLDLTFGQAGRAGVDFDNPSPSFLAEADLARDLALQSDGKIVVVGQSFDNFALARFNSDGSLDESFGNGGKVTTEFSPDAIDAATAVVIQADGQILVGGGIGVVDARGLFLPADFLLARYNSNGTLDASFGNGGFVTTNFSGTGFNTSSDSINDIVLQADGKIIAAGSSRLPLSAQSDFALARYHADGSLDASFGTGGLATTDFGNPSGESIAEVALQADGKIVAAGSSGVDFALARYHADGSLDNTFDVDGVATLNFRLPSDAFDRIDFGRGVAIQADGKIVLVGQSTGFNLGEPQPTFALARYNTDGSLDDSFGDHGIILTGFVGGSSDLGRGLVVQPDGKIVVVGHSLDRDGVTDIGSALALARYNSDGSLDSSFGSDGLVRTAFPSPTDLGAGAAALQTDGKLVVALPTFFGQFSLIRYNRDGSVDHAFGKAGVVTPRLPKGPTGVGTVGIINHIEIAIQSDGKIVVASSHDDGFSPGPGLDFVLVRFNPDGSLDATFNGDGVVVTGFFPRRSDRERSSDDGHALALQEIDGETKIVVVGDTEDFRTPGKITLSRDFALARYNQDGSLDTTFGDGGKVTTDFASGSDSARDVVVQPDGKIVVVGSADLGNINMDFALARYNVDGSLDNSFGAGGKATLDFFGHGESDEAHTVAIQADGKIVVAGQVVRSHGYLSFGVARFLPNGTLDTKFGKAGKVTIQFGGASDDQPFGLAMQPDGKIVVAGTSQSYNKRGSPDFALARLDPRGRLDSTFGRNGRVTTNFSQGSADIAFALLLQPDGTIVVVGESSIFGGSTGRDIALTRYVSTTEKKSRHVDSRLDDSGEHGRWRFRRTRVFSWSKFDGFFHGSVVGKRLLWNEACGPIRMLFGEVDFPLDTHFEDASGRSVSIVGPGRPIQELL